MAPLNGKPTIVLVPGAWHTAYHAAPLITTLEAKGYRAQAHQLAMTGLKSKRPLFADDVNMVYSAVTAELGAGRDVCLVLHSYAGMSGAETVNKLMAEGRVNTQTASDGRGRLLRVVFIAAYAFPAGFVLDAKDFGREDGRFGVSEDGMNTMTDPRIVFFNDIESDFEAQKWVDALEPAYYQERTPCISSDAWREAPITVLGMEKDDVIPPERQKMVWQGFEMKWLDAGHTPYVSKPEMIADEIIDAIGKS